MGSGTELELNSVLRSILEVLDRPSFQEGVWRGSVVAEEKVPSLLAAHPELVELAREVEAIKKKVIENLDHYIALAVESLKKVRAHPYVVSDHEEARSILKRIVGRGKLVIMSKSMVAEELGVREFLEELGNEVWETDLGQLLVQLEGGKPMHTIAPAVHMTRERAVEMIREKIDRGLPPDADAEQAVAAVRRFLRGKFSRADVGISGANALAADTGAIVLVENEGNIRLVTGFPPVHVALVGIDKIVPTFMDALKVAMVQAAYAGLYPPTYLNVIAGPSNTADIELTRVYGAHGPKELHVLLVDNGRKKAAKHPMLWEQLRCVRCGRCQYECPVWRHTANVWGGPVYGGPMGVNWTAITLGEDQAAEIAHLCLGCARCDAVCPMEIPISKIIRYLKTVYARKHKIA
jgi:L-lactate dehydrogenase complex protein LldG